MEATPMWYIILIQAIVSAVVLAITSITTGYYSKRGENLATKKDIRDITKKIETVKNEISFESQRTHSYIEQRANRFVEILHLAEEASQYGCRIKFYLYNLDSAERLTSLIDRLKDIMLEIKHEHRLLNISVNDSRVINEEINSIIDGMIQSADSYSEFLCGIAASALIYMRDWDMKARVGLELKKSPHDMLEVNKSGLDTVREHYNKYNDNGQNHLNHAISAYMDSIKELFDKQFHIKL